MSLVRALLAVGLCCLLQRAARAEALHCEPLDDRIVVKHGDVLLATYCWKDAKITRPYFHELRTLRGAQVTRNHPPREGDVSDHADFHPGLWLAFGDLSGADSWRLKAKVDATPTKIESAGESTGFSAIHTYYADDGQRALCKEVAQYTFELRPQGWLLLCDSEFSSDDADFALGDQEEMGLGVRVHTPLAVVSGQGGRILATERRKNEREVWGQASPWCDYAGPLDGRFVGITLMSHPKNFRAPWWHVRDYGLAVANPFGRSALARGERSSVVVKSGEKFRLRFGVLVHDTAAETDFDPVAGFDDYVQLTAGGE